MPPYVTMCYYVSLYATIRHYMALYATICHYTSLYGTTCHYMPLYAIIRHYTSLCGTIRHYVPLYATICHYMSQTEKLSKFEDKGALDIHQVQLKLLFSGRTLCVIITDLGNVCDVIVAVSHSIVMTQKSLNWCLTVLALTIKVDLHPGLSGSALNPLIFRHSLKIKLTSERSLSHFDKRAHLRIPKALVTRFLDLIAF